MKKLIVLFLLVISVCTFASCKSYPRSKPTILDSLHAEKEMLMNLSFRTCTDNQRYSRSCGEVLEQLRYVDEQILERSI